MQEKEPTPAAEGDENPTLPANDGEKPNDTTGQGIDETKPGNDA